MKKPAKNGASSPVAHAENSGKGVRAHRQAGRKQAQEEPNGLPNGMERLRATIEASVDCIITIDANSTILEFNAAAERTFGYAREEVLGKSLTETIIPPSLRDAHLRGMAALLEGGGSKLLGRRVEMPAMRADGSEFPVELTITRITSQGAPFFTAYLRDITERKRAEEELSNSLALLRTITQGTTDAVFAKDRQGRYIMANTATAHFVGKSSEEVIGLDDTALFSTETAARIMERDRSVLESGETRTDEDVGTTAEGVFRVYLTTKGPLLDSSGAINGVFGIARDITERKRAEEKLRESEARFRELAENIDEVFWVWTVNLGSARLLYVSPAYATIWGRSCESLYASPQSWKEALHPDDREGVLAAIAALDLESMNELTYRIVRPDKSIRWISDRIFPVRDQRGVVVRFAGIARDITESKRAEQTLRQAEDRIRLIIDTIPTMAWTLGPDGMVDFVNQRWIDYTGLSLEQEVKEPSRPIHPEDLPRVMDKWHVDSAAGELVEDEMRLRRADGEYRWFLVRTAPLHDEQGNIIKWYGVSTDIEDRKQAEMQARTLIDAIPQEIWSGPADGTLDYCNARWRSYMGIGLKDLQGDGWQSMLHPNDRDRVLKAWHDSVVNGTPYQQEERHLGADGNYRWFLARGVPLRDAEGRIVRWYGTNTDIEDRKRTEEALRKSERLFAAFMDHLPGFAWIKDLEGRYVYVNKKEAELEAYRDGAIGKTDADLWPQEIVSAYRANDEQVIATRKSLQAVEPSLMNGEQSYMLVSKFPIFAHNGSVVMVAGAGVDVTDLTQAKNALNAQALRYKALMETSTDSIYVVDEKGDLQEANAAFLHRRGYTAAEVKGLNVADWDAQWSPEKLRERLRGLRESGAVFETRHRCKDGSLFDVEVCASGVRIAGEQLFFCVTRDITERKQAEARLRRSEEKFKTLFGIAPVGISVLDRQHNVIDANPALEQITRLRKEELLNGTHRQRRILNADGTPMLPHEFPSERAITENRPVNNVEAGIVTENGEIIWVQVSVAPLALPDASAVVITQDITERKRAEEELTREKEILAKIFNNIPVMIGFVGDDGGVRLVNPEWERTMGWTLKELREQNVDIFAEAYPDLAYRQKVLDFVAAATGEWVDLKIKGRDGRVINAACAVVHLSDGTKVAIAQDITERKRAAEALEAANHQLRILSRQLFHIQEEERRHLARELHDEIGQTLTAAKINLKIIAPDAPAKITGRLDDSIQLIDQLLRQVRQLSLDLRPPLLDELGLVPTLRWLVDHQAQRAGLRVIFAANVNGLELDPDVQTTCFRVAQEALTNIIRHSGAKNVAVELRREPERLALSVRDDGAGFDPAMIQQRTPQDFSLGLVSMKERALLVHGGFEVHSAPGHGTEIRAWFPLPSEKCSSVADTA